MGFIPYLTTEHYRGGVLGTGLDPAVCQLGLRLDARLNLRRELKQGRLAPIKPCVEAGVTVSEAVLGGSGRLTLAPATNTDASHSVICII